LSFPVHVFKENSSCNNFIFSFSPLLILPVISLSSMAAFSLYHISLSCKICEIEVSPFFTFAHLLCYIASVYIFILPFLSWPHIINHTSSHHHSFVASIFSTFITNRQDVTLTNARSVLIIFHSSACGTLIARRSVPHSLAPRVHSWNPSFFVSAGYYRKTRMKLMFFHKSGTSRVTANSHPSQTERTLFFFFVKLYQTSF
jgi:hypothetical protein